ncbi:MAG: carboxyl transferase domain-containing protein, partial [Paracoccaceae bacterium]
MATFLTKIQKNTSSFKANIKDHMTLIDEMRSLEKRTIEKSEQRKPRFRERGQLTPRERLSALLDPGLPFLELFNFAGYLVDDQNPDTSYPGANMIMGVGFINGTRCFIWVDDSGINAGATTTQSMEKGLAGITMAKRQKLPFVHLVESAGANLMAYTVELWAKGGGLFAGLAELSAMGIPIITVLHGPSTAGGAYQPGLSDYVVGIKNNGMAALAGAALVKAATGEVSSDRELGGSEMHSKSTGLVEFLAEDDRHGIEIAREIVKSLDWKKGISCSREGEWTEPLHSADELIGLVPV